MRLRNQILVSLLERVARGHELGHPLPSGRPVLAIHVDGMGRAQLRRFLLEGRLPRLRALLDGRRYALSPMMTGAPSSTPQFLAAMGYGASPDVAGFEWYDRRHARHMHFSQPEVARDVERRVAAGGRRPLLGGGAAYLSLFEGGTTSTTLFGPANLAARAAPARRGHGENGWRRASRLLCESEMVVEIVARALPVALRGLVDGARAARGMRRLQHEPGFFVKRFLTSTVFPPATVGYPLMEMARGTPFIYTCLYGYDEVAHRRGPFSAQALQELSGIDAAIGDLAAAVERRPELRYDLYVLSDHGHIDTEPFERRTGTPLDQWILLAGAGASIDASGRIADTGAARSLARALSLARRAEERTSLAARALALDRRVRTVTAGDLAHVYFREHREPLTAPAIAVRFPRVLEALARCPAIGLVLARGDGGPVGWWRGRRLELSRPADRARVGLLDGGELLTAYATRLCRIPTAGDLILLGNGTERRPDTAFAWELGSHGGLARAEVDTFMLHPNDVPFPQDVTLPEQLYDFFTERYELASIPEPQRTAEAA